MAKTKSEMFTLIGANLPDNTTGLITPEKLREVMTQMADSPIYATPGVKEVEVLRAASTVTQAPTAVDTALQLTFGSAQGSASNPVMINATKLVSADVTIPIESRVVINPTAGQTFAVQIMRDSAGSNFGGVYPQAATVTAWGTAPSALLVISRLEAA